MAAKSYLDLKSEVWDTGRCSGCGACVAVCPADALFFDEGEMVTAPRSNGYCKQATDSVPCGACYAVCPRTIEQPAEELGEYLELVSAHAAIDVPRRQSGGAVTAILANALDEGLIDAVVTVTEDHWTLRPSSVVITKSDVLIQQAGSRYSWWVPLLAALKYAVVERKFRKIAVVGVPCAVQALARIRTSDNDLLKPYAKAIRLVVGLFCTETFDYTALVHGKLQSHYQTRGPRDPQAGCQGKTRDPEKRRHHDHRPACRTGELHQDGLPLLHRSHLGVFRYLCRRGRQSRRLDYADHQDTHGQGIR